MASPVINTASSTAPNPVKIDVGEDPSLEKIHESLVKRAPSGVVKTAQMQATSESTIADLTRSENLLDSVTVSPETVVETVLMKFPVSPLMSKPGLPTRMAYVAKLFRFWRGIISLNFVFTKTILQQMKIAVTYVPGATVDSPAPTKGSLTQQSHRKVINPANEMEVEFDIPFVSKQPFLEMSEATGMIYVQVFQGFTGTTDPDAFMAIDVFVSSDKLEMHEYAPIPDVDGGLEEIDPQWVFLYTLASGMPFTAAQQAQNIAYVSDSGVTVNHLCQDATIDVTWATAGKPIAASNGFTSGAGHYDPQVCRTLYGDPRATMVQSRIVFVLYAPDQVGRVAMISVTFGRKGAFMKRFDGVAASYELYYGPISDLSHTFAGEELFVVTTAREVDAMRREVAELRQLMLDCAVQNRCGNDETDDEDDDSVFELALPTEEADEIVSSDPDLIVPPNCEVEASEALELSDDSNDGDSELDDDVKKMCCITKIRRCCLPCQVCDLPFIGDSFAEQCECEQHWCALNMHPDVVGLTKGDIQCWVIHSLDKDELEPNQFLDYALDRAVFGEIRYNSSNVFTAPTALVALYFDESQQNQEQWHSLVGKAIRTWCTPSPKDFPLFLARVWYLYSRVKYWKGKFNLDRFDGWIRLCIADAFVGRKLPVFFYPRHTSPAFIDRIGFLRKSAFLDQ